jgi:4-carboxymuconolactone decarboxylase
MKRNRSGGRGSARIGVRADVEEDIRDKLLPAVAAAVSVGDARRLKRYLTGALAAGVPLRDLEEVILQCYLFAGFPAALEGFVALREVCDTPAKGRVRAARISPGLFVKRGEKLCRTVYGAKYAPLRQRSLELHPDLWSWMIVEGYGKVLSRPPLDPAQRELCIIACLVSTGWNRQLRSHVHGALNVGCSPESIIEAVRVAGYVAGRWPLRWGLGLAREEIAKASYAASGSRERVKAAPRSVTRPPRRAVSSGAKKARKVSKPKQKAASRKRK